MGIRSVNTILKGSKYFTKDYKADKRRIKRDKKGRWSLL
jgi:hypothetical protein